MLSISKAYSEQFACERKCKKRPLDWQHRALLFELKIKRIKQYSRFTQSVEVTRYADCIT